LKIAKNGHQGKAIALAKSLLWVEKLKMQKKQAKNVSTTHCSCSMEKPVRRNS